MGKSKREQYINIRGKNMLGYEMEVIDYECYDHITVKFLPPYEYITTTSMERFKKGYVRNPYAPTVCGYGITGNKYSTIQDKTKHTIEYTTWENMIRRCYDEKNRFKNPSYIDVECNKEWQYYENFYEWMNAQENYHILKNLNDINLDKDILNKGNREYGPDKCTLVPRKVNNLLLRSNSIRGKYPIGVRYYPKNKKYVADCGGHDNHKYIGIYPTVEEAFIAYKNYKENQIREIAKEEYSKKTITKQCYDKLMSYQVEITD